MAHGSRGAVGQTASHPNATNGSNGVLTASNPPKGNPKKAKRRAKEAAKRKEQEAQAQAQSAAAMQQQVDTAPPPNSATARKSDKIPAKQNALDPDEYDDYDGQELYDEDQYYSDDDPVYQQEQYDPAYAGASHPGHPPMNGTDKKSKKKKKNTKDPYAHPHGNHYSAHVPPPPPPPPGLRTAHRGGRGDRIWNTSTQEERERIKEFWLSLKEEERRSLVKVEKEAVLKKMKEQQKHSCSCTVCGRKRTAIEEELEVLYDAYYEELEQYGHFPPVPPPPLSCAHQQNNSLPPDRMPPLIHPSEQDLGDFSDEDELPEEDEYSDDEYDDDDYSDEEPEELPRSPEDFFHFGNSLTVKGGILTVADDLLKNDGKKFIEMMERLAERRMAREEEAQYAAAAHPPYDNYRHGHVGPDDDEFDEDDDEEYDSQEEYEDEEEDMDTMTEEQRMNEGRRMFQIFAARMFEQRVLTAYREKVAAERQAKLIQELDEEQGLAAAREAKKANQNEKKKAKKLAQKQKQAEEKAKKDAEKAALEASAKAEQEKKAEEQRKRKEEQRIKKEEQRKAQEAEQARKQAEKIKRQKEEQERRQEQERKAREQKEAERKAREETKKKEREEREAREREAKERKAKADQERKEKDARDKAEAERLRKETQTQAAQQAAQAAKRAAAPAPVPIPPGLTKQPSGFASSPHVQPALPKAPTPVRPRQGSQQGSKGSSPKTPAALAGQSKSGSPGVIGGGPSQSQNIPIAPKQILSRPPSQPPVTNAHQQGIASPMTMPPPPGMGMPQGGPFAMPPGLNGFTPGQGMQGMQRPPMPPGMFSPPQQPIGGPFQRGFGMPNGMPGPPPGMGAPGMPPFGGRMPEGPPGFPQMPGGDPRFGGFPDTMPARSMPANQHSRQQSGSSNVDQPAPIGSTTNGPIRPPAPIQRPSSVKPQGGDMDDLAKALGSSALLDDDESPEPNFADRRPSHPPGLQHGASDPTSFGPPGFNNRGAPRLESSFSGLTGAGGNTWGTPSIPYGTPVIPGAPNWGGSPTGGWAPGGGGFGLGLGNVPSAAGRPRHIQIRIFMVESYKMHPSRGSDGFVDAKTIFQTLQSSTVRPPITPDEMANLLDTEGTSANGGGTFQVRKTGDGDLDCLIKWSADDGQSMGGPNRGIGQIGGGGAGEIGSPIVGASHPVGSQNNTPFGSLRGFPGLSGGLTGLGQGL